MTQTLGTLGLSGLEHVGPAPDPAMPITGLTADSREVRDGFLFAALPGTRLDGADFAQYAIRQGAAAILAAPEGVDVIRRDTPDLTVPVLLASHPRQVLARVAARFFGAQPETMIAVTGTNGKTSVAQFTRQIWEHAGLAAAALGTTGVLGAGFERPLGMTTPDPVTLHRLLATLAREGCTHASMEASSHGLAQYRVDGVRLAAAALTNVTRDHLDYHRDFDDYAGAKMRLLHSVLPRDGVGVLNADDPGFDLARMATAGRRYITVGAGAEATLRLVSTTPHQRGQSIAFTYDGAGHTADLALIGGFQASNALMAAGLAIATGVAPSTAFAALGGLTGVRGRMELVSTRANGGAVIVDYAHTPDAIETALAALRPHFPGTIIVVAGAGGDRDPGKRRLMGEAMAKGADIAIVTDDNPRSEDPEAIRAAMRAGCPEASDIGDRAEAILTGIDALRAPGDCVLIAGKGHEQGQEIAGETHPFDDAAQARAAVAVLDGSDTPCGSA